ncbi:MAG: hypothetical protein LIP02_04095 [Bacteroidales bacterium]|nr:hypothetical protein [Bacteroidales bacterium]
MERKTNPSLALGGGNSQPIILTTNNTMQTRQERIDHKWMPDGSIRGFDSDKGSGISEEQYTATAAPSDTVSTDPKRIKVLLTPQRDERAKAKRRANNGVDDFADKRLLPKVDQSADDCLTVSSGSGNHGDQLILDVPLPIRQSTRQGYIDVPPGGVFDASYPDSDTRRGRVQGDGQLSPTVTATSNGLCRYEGAVMVQKCGDRGTDNYSFSDTSYTIAANPMSDREQMLVEPVVMSDPCSRAKENPTPSSGHSPALRATDYKCPPIAIQPDRVEYRIRKITPREALRLMDVDEENIDRIQNHTWVTTLKDGTEKINRISKTRQYALAGNSIVVACMERIFANLFAPAPRVKAEGEWITFEELFL